MALIWAAAWFGAGLLLARVPGFFSDVPFAILFAPLGFASGLVFSGVLVAVAGRGKLDRVSLPRFAGWGAVSGLLLSGVLVGGAALRGEALGGEALAFGAVLAAAGAVCAAGSLAVARRGGRPELPASERVLGEADRRGTIESGD